MQRGNRDRALSVINNMTDEWCRIHVLAKQARLTVGSMVRFLVQAKKKGIVENQQLNGRHGLRIGEWRRKEGGGET